MLEGQCLHSVEGGFHRIMKRKKQIQILRRIDSNSKFMIWYQRMIRLSWGMKRILKRAWCINLDCKMLKRLRDFLSGSNFAERLLYICAPENSEKSFYSLLETMRFTLDFSRCISTSSKSVWKLWQIQISPWLNPLQSTSLSSAPLWSSRQENSHVTLCTMPMPPSIAICLRNYFSKISAHSLKKQTNKLIKH